MSHLEARINRLNWQNVREQLHQQGYALVPKMLTPRECQRLIKTFDEDSCYRKTVVMERFGYGRGVYKYWDYPLPEIVQILRASLYPNLVPVANTWMQQLRDETVFPPELVELQEACHAKDQRKPTPLLLHYKEGGFNTLHQDLYGEVYFPLQAACFLNQRGVDYDGGEFVLVQQKPRAQSQAIVLTPERGDMLIFSTRFRPQKGTRGWYRMTMKHGVSEVKSGERYAMGIIFHDALS